jgi:DNA-binding MarR family transcriptional regulator
MALSGRVGNSKIHKAMQQLPVQYLHRQIKSPTIARPSGRIGLVFFSSTHFVYFGFLSMTIAVNPTAPQRNRSASQTGRAGGRVPAYYRPDRMEDQRGLLSLLRRVELALAQLVSEATDLGGPTAPQWALLHKVHQGRANTVVGLARACRVDAGAMTRLLDRIEKNGLCRRVPCADDRRVVQIELTPEGQAAAERVPPVLSQVYNRALAGFSRDEWRQLLDLLTRLADDAERLSLKNGNCS